MELPPAEVGERVKTRLEAGPEVKWSRSAWTSVLIKSLRLGWPEGMREAARHLPRSRVRQTLVVQVFEDIFPAVSEIDEVLAEIRRDDYEALCRRETHHGRGLTQAFYDLRVEACEAPKTELGRAPLVRECQRLGIWLGFRGFNCLYTWLKLAPEDAGRVRSVDQRQWYGMPRDMVDRHVAEGRATNVGDTILSGTYGGHLKLARLVTERGWDFVRDIVHGHGAF
jgi:hypothetical protein